MAKRTIEDVRKDLILARAALAGAQISGNEDLAEEQRVAIRSLEDEERTLGADTPKIEERKKKLYTLLSYPNDQKNDYYYAYIGGKYALVENLARSEDKINLLSRLKLEADVMIGELNDHIGIPGYFDCLRSHDLREVFQQAGRKKSKIASSMDKEEYPDESCFNVLDIPRKYWPDLMNRDDLERDENGEIMYYEMWDDFAEVLGDAENKGTENNENIKFIEQWMPHGLIYPERNFLGPHLNLTGQPGGNFKTVLIDALRTAYTDTCVNLASAQSSTSGFNGGIEFSTINVYDDQKKEFFNQAYLKSIMGNPKILVMYKGADQFESDNNARTIIIDNDEVWECVGGGIDGEDRRMAIMVTSTVAVEWIAKKRGISKTEARARISDFIKKYVKNRKEVRKYFAAMVEKHGMDKSGYELLPLHGSDYRARVNSNGDAVKDAIESLIPVFKEQGIMPFPVLKKAVEALTGMEWKKDTVTLTRAWEGYCRRNGVKFYTFKREYINMTHSNDKTVKHQCNGWIFNSEIISNKDFAFDRVSRGGYSKIHPIAPDDIQIYEYDESETLFESDEVKSLHVKQQKLAKNKNV